MGSLRRLLTQAAHFRRHRKAVVFLDQRHHADDGIKVLEGSVKAVHCNAQQHQVARSRERSVGDGNDLVDVGEVDEAVHRKRRRLMAAR